MGGLHFGDGRDCLGSWPFTSCDSLRGKDQNAHDTKGPFFRWGSFFATCSVKSRDVLHRQGTQASPQDGCTAITGDKHEAHMRHQGSKRTGRAGLH